MQQVISGSSAASALRQATVARELTGDVLQPLCSLQLCTTRK